MWLYSDWRADKHIKHIKHIKDKKHIKICYV